MKLYEIVNESEKTDTEACLIHYEKADVFVAEIKESSSGDLLPLILASFIEKGIYTIDPVWSRRFVESRIIPHERQNLGAILKRYGLNVYDCGKLLELSKGRCAQDDCAILPLSKEPEWLIRRQASSLKDALVLHDTLVMMQFQNNEIHFADLQSLIDSDKRFSFLAGRPSSFEDLKLIPGGHGICWNDSIYLMNKELSAFLIDYQPGSDDLYKFFDTTLLSTRDVCQKLNCSRQYVDSLLKRNKLQVARDLDSTRLFFRSDINKLKW